jgi:hypothetical protein
MRKYNKELCVPLWNLKNKSSLKTTEPRFRRYHSVPGCGILYAPF